MGIAFTIMSTLLYYIFFIETVESKLLAEFPVKIQSSAIEKIAMPQNCKFAMPLENQIH